MNTTMKFINYKMPTSTPEEQGISSAYILNFLDQLEKENFELHSLQIIRNGKLIASTVAAPYTMDSFHRIFSAAKGVVATAMLLTIQEGYYSLDDLVVPHIPKEWLPEDLDEKWNRLTIYHLLTNNAGHDSDTLFKMWGLSDCWIKTFFENRPAYEPGTYFLYDMGVQYVMNELVRLATGLDVGQYLKTRIFEPLRIEYTNNYTEPEGLFFSSSIQFKPDALTKLALLYLQEGEWEGKQLIRKDLAIMAGQHHSPSSFKNRVTGQAGVDEFAGYCFHMRRNSIGGFRFSGGQGQNGIILPEHNMVISTMSSDNRHDLMLEMLFDYICKTAYMRPVSFDPIASEKLKKRLKNFNLAPKGVSDSSSTAEKVNGIRYKFDPNNMGQESISFEFAKDEVKIHTVSEKGERTHICGLRGEWKHSKGYLLMKKRDDEIADLDRNFGYDVTDNVLSGGWSDLNTFKFYLRSDSLLCDYRFECTFDSDNLEVKLPPNATAPRGKSTERVVLRARKLANKT